MDPPGTNPEDVTGLLAAAGRGDEEASSRLFPIIYDQLHRLATVYMHGERPDHTLQPTALVHEAYLRLIGPDAAAGRFESRNHFVAVAAVAMRRILVNHAKAKHAQKRGGEFSRLSLDDVAETFSERAIDLLALDEAMDRLALIDPAQAQLVELRFFGGLSVEECAATIGVSVRSVQYEWAHARAWLRAQLEAV